MQQSCKKYFLGGYDRNAHVCVDNTCTVKFYSISLIYQNKNTMTTLTTNINYKKLTDRYNSLNNQYIKIDTQMSIEKNDYIYSILSDKLQQIQDKMSIISSKLELLK